MARIVKTVTVLWLAFCRPGLLWAQTRISLGSDNPAVQWRIKPQAEVDSVKMVQLGYDTRDWVPGVVPGVVFDAYVRAGLEKDPNYADNIYHVDKSKYDRNFWYRTEFATPVGLAGGALGAPGANVGATPAAVGAAAHLWLHFRGVNRKGEVFLNGVRLGLLDGFMQRGDYDITGLVAPGGRNVLAVLVHWPGLPIPNHASPTYISSDGWDWMPSVPGLLNGITDEVYLTETGRVTIVDPWIRTEVPSRKEASIAVRVGLDNHSGQTEEGVLKAVIQPGNIVLSRKVTLGRGPQDVSFDRVRVQDPALWWPNGYGAPNLYTCDVTFTVDGQVSDSRRVTFGIRQYGYDTTGGVLHIKVNGERIFVRGGNWGMSEYLLRCRGAEYDVKVRLHREMHLNMIRNWIGSTTDEAFYDACDKYGIMVWDDFWLNSHPNLPDDVFAFNANAVEKIKRFRNHPSIAVWCGDNEGTPLPPLNGWLREDVSAFDGGDRWYQPNSHLGALTGSGPWTNAHPTWYFTRYPGGFGGSPGWGFRTEIGTAVFPTYESFSRFMPDSTWWPRNPMWDKHFFGPSAANAGPDSYMATIDASYGKAEGIKDFCRKAQLLNIETNKALYEGWQHHIWDDASGVMTWMSQSAYPSMVWQTYDYYYDLTGAYWGVRKACEPIHIQWSYADNSVKVINTTLDDLHGLHAQAIVYDLDGRPLPAYGRTAVVDAPSDTATACFSLDFGIDDLARQKTAVASSGATEAPDAGAVTDGNAGSRWSSAYRDDEWIYVDLGEPREIGAVTLHWEAAYGKAYKIQVSGDAVTWKDVYATGDGKGGIDPVTFAPVTAQYVRMLGIRRATAFGYSLYDFEVYGRKRAATSPLHFIRLLLKDDSGRLLSDNFYWRGNQLSDYTALNKLRPVRLRVTSRFLRGAASDTIEATVTNPTAVVAFAVRLQAVRAATGDRILPALQDDNYFTLLPGESRKVGIEFDPTLLGSDGYKLIVEPYNHPQ
ncbi:galactose-binding domain-containing protein [Dinghuibacter silviterrae]|uniref:Glycosyl hydrolase family 2 n=1 Tax=Dinghuibacter silviterrae TaxID=1539049 RepID=A0A4R8DG41_9BACT|nr:discoidin domain-containing protein [Dinghuibacter silviterrae]TDW96328.1 glycosyl hydrolase family 2 [Dinghuibacter silviterrae]